MHTRTRCLSIFAAIMRAPSTPQIDMRSGPAFLDWTSQPSPYKRFDGARLIELPLSAGPATAFPGPAPDPAPLDCRALGLFLELAFGLSAWKSVEGSTWARA